LVFRHSLVQILAFAGHFVQHCLNLQFIGHQLRSIYGRKAANQIWPFDFLQQVSPPLFPSSFKPQIPIRLTKFTISAVWVISAFLAIPPFISDLFLITDSKEQMEDLLGTNYSDAFLEFAGTCTPVTNSDLYILFSATISFILPMILMVLIIPTLN